jgi:hypothetical protein
MARARTACIPGNVVAVAVGLGLALGLGAAGCQRGAEKKKSGPAASAPQLALRPAAEARADLVAEVVAPNLERSFTTLAEVAAKLGLPTSTQDMRRFLLADKGAPRQAFDQLDLSRPVAVVVVAAAPAAVGKSYILMAAALKDPSADAFQRWLPRWATIKERDADAVKVAAQAGDAGGAGDAGSATWTGWLLHRDGGVCVGHDKAALVAGCAVALAARRQDPPPPGPGAGPEHLRATLVPEGIARAQGTTLAQALASARDEALAGAPASDAGLANQQRLARVAMDGVLAAVGDVATVQAALSLDQQRGLALRLGARPRPGSALEKTLAGPRPFAIDPALLYGPTPAALFALGSTDTLWDIFAKMVAETEVPPASGRRRASQPASAAVSAAVAALKDALTSPSAGRVRFVEGPQPELRYELVYGLKPEADPERVLTAWQAMARADWMTGALGPAAGKLKVKVSARREGATLVTRMVVDPRSLPPDLRRLSGIPPFDGRPLESRALVDGRRLLVATGADGKAALEALRLSPPPSPPAGPLGTALAEAQGEDGFFFADLAPLLRSMVIWAERASRSAGGSPSTGPMAVAAQAQTLLANVELATWASHRTGADLGLRWRLPMSTLESMAGIVRQSLGLLGGALFTPTPTP